MGGNFFGEAIEQVDVLATSSKIQGPQNLLDMLPDSFTREEAGRLRQRQGIRRGSLKLMLSNWKSRGYITLEFDGADDINQQVYRKTETYLARHG